MHRDPRVSTLLSKLPIPPTPSLAIIVSLAYAKCGGESPSFWGPYLSLLPTELDSLIHKSLFDTSADGVCSFLLSELDGLSERVVEERKALRNGCAALHALDSHLTLGALAWAHAMYSSRAMTIPTHGPAMVPLFDTCNHAYSAPSVFTLGTHYPPLTDPAPPLVALMPHGKEDTTLPSSVFAGLLEGCLPAAPAAGIPAKKPLLPPLAPSSTSLSLSLACPIEGGGEVLISYGTKSTFSFALLSGFLPGPNQVDSLRLVILPSSPSGPSLSVAPSDWAGPVFTLRACAGESVPMDLLLAAAGEMVVMVGGGAATITPPPFNPALSDPQAFVQGLGVEDGVRVVQWVVQQCEGLRGGIREPPTTLLKAGEAPAVWVTLAAGVRAAAVRVLDTAIGDLVQCY